MKYYNFRSQDLKFFYEFSGFTLSAIFFYSLTAQLLVDFKKYLRKFFLFKIMCTFAA